MQLSTNRGVFVVDVVVVFCRLVLLDVNARRSDIEAAEHQDVDMEEIFTMESEDVKNGNDDRVSITYRIDQAYWAILIYFFTFP